MNTAVLPNQSEANDTLVANPEEEAGWIRDIAGPAKPVLAERLTRKRSPQVGSTVGRPPWDGGQE